MINILLEGYDISKEWIYTRLKEYIKPSHRVVVVALAFRDNEVRDVYDWNKLYAKDRGRIFCGIANSFGAYGVKKENISVVNYFTDTKEFAKNKIKWADIVYFPGGLPHKLMERIMEMELLDVLQAHCGIVMGNSAGALIQLDEYHISPDHDYPEFGYYKGLGYTGGFYLEVHYENSPVQNSSVKKVIDEKNTTVYATHLMQGAVIVNEGEIELMGQVDKYVPEGEKT